LRSLISAVRRTRSADETVNDIPVRMRQTRTRRPERESLIGFVCQAGTTRNQNLVPCAAARLASKVWPKSRYNASPVYGRQASAARYRSSDVVSKHLGWSESSSTSFVRWA
jgi:hypothetical protein